MDNKFRGASLFRIMEGKRSWSDLAVPSQHLPGGNKKTSGYFSAADLRCFYVHVNNNVTEDDLHKVEAYTTK